MTLKNVSLKETIGQQYKSVVKYLPVYFSTVWKRNMYIDSDIQINAETQQVVLNPAPGSAGADLAVFSSHPLWPFILVVCVACAGFFPGLVCSCVHNLRLSKPNMEKSSHTTPNSAAVPSPHRV